MSTQGKISYSAAVLMSINIMVGAGILVAVGPMTASANSISFLAWPLIGLLLFPVIWCISKAAQIYPGEGGFYHYCSTGLNSFAGFIAHWGYLLGYLGTATSLTIVLREGFINNTGIEFLKGHPIVFNLAIVLFYTAMNLISVEKTSRIQSMATILKITPIVTVIALFVFYFNPGLEFHFSQLQNIGLTVSSVIFAYWGFEACCSIGGLLRDGPQKVFSVILVGFFVTMALYFLFHFGLLYIMGPENLAQYGAIAFPRFLDLPPAWSSAFQIGISIAVLFSWANSILGVSLTNIANIHFLARKKHIFGAKLLTIENKNQRPIYAALIHGIVFLLFVTFVDNLDIAFALTNLGVILAFVLTLMALTRTYYQRQDYLQLLITLLAFGSCAALIYYTIIKIPAFVYVMPLVIGLVIGVIMFKVQKARQWKEVPILNPSVYVQQKIRLSKPLFKVLSQVQLFRNRFEQALNRYPRMKTGFN